MSCFEVSFKCVLDVFQMSLEEEPDIADIIVFPILIVCELLAHKVGMRIHLYTGIHLYIRIPLYVKVPVSIHIYI